MHCSSQCIVTRSALFLAAHCRSLQCIAISCSIPLHRELSALPLLRLRLCEVAGSRLGGSRFRQLGTGVTLGLPLPLLLLPGGCGDTATSKRASVTKQGGVVTKQKRLRRSTRGLWSSWHGLHLPLPGPSRARGGMPRLVLPQGCPQRYSQLLYSEKLSHPPSRFVGVLSWGCQGSSRPLSPQGTRSSVTVIASQSPASSQSLTGPSRLVTSHPACGS